jgi:hypothetical protein
MSIGPRRKLPARLEIVRRRFERWRRTCTGRSRIPDSLWAMAVELADAYGIHPTARALRVDYYSLKKRTEAEPAAEPGLSEEAAATFLELPRPGSASPCQCTLECEDASGARMRVHLTSEVPPDLAALSRSFWNPLP